MKRPAIVALGVLAAITLAARAIADNYYFRDGQGQLMVMASKILNNTQYPIHLLYGLNGGAAVPMATDASGNLGVNVVSAGGPAFAATGITPITGSLAATGQSAAFTPAYGRPVNIAFSGTGIFALRLERKFVGDATWYPIGSMTGQRYTWSTDGTQTVTVSDFFTESESGVTLRWNVTGCTGCSLTYRISE